MFVCTELEYLFITNLILCTRYIHTLCKIYINIYIYYTTWLKSVQITSKTSTNIQRYSDSWLFVHFRFDEFFLANQIASTRKYFMYAN